MKKLLILAALLSVTASTAGCRCLNWLFRGCADPCAPAPVATTCVPTYNPCDPCGGAVSPGPEAYAPAVTP